MKTTEETFSFSGRIRSVRHAVAGISAMLRNQHNAWLHALATVIVIAAGAIFQVATTEWIALVFAITLVWVAEALNTALEYLCDVASPDFHPLAKKSKDVAAGGVLLTAVGAAIVGLLVFFPYVS